MKFYDHLQSNIGVFFFVSFCHTEQSVCACVCVGLTGGEFLLTEAAVSLLHLNSDSTSELDVPVPLPGVHFILENTHNGVILTTDVMCAIFVVILIVSHFTST